MADPVVGETRNQRWETVAFLFPFLASSIGFLFTRFVCVGQVGRERQLLGQSHDKTPRTVYHCQNRQLLTIRQATRPPGKGAHNA